MGGPLSRDAFNPNGINTPLLGVSFASLLFNSVRNGRCIASNMYSNTFLIVALGVSNGLYGILDEPLWGARLGLLASVFFTAGAPLRVLFTSRLFPRYVHYGIGGFYCSYHSLQLHKAKEFFEDAGEDGADEVF